MLKRILKQKSSGCAAAAIAGAAMLLAISSLAADAVKYEGKPGGKVSIEGTSTVHDWTMEGKIIVGTFELPAGVVIDPSQAAITGAADGKLKAKTEVSIPVRSLKSGKQGMDEVMQQAMNEPTHKRIEYHVEEMTLKQPHVAGTPFQFDTKGALVVNGVTNKISMVVTIDAPDKSSLKISGSVPLKMTDYKVTPPAPTIGLGLIKTADDIKITFVWILGLPEK